MARFLKSLRYALHGVKKAATSERNFRLQVVAGIVVVVAGFVFGLNRTEWLILIFWIVAVLSAELFNSAIEQICNQMHVGYHPGIKKIKDFAAGAVLFVAAGAAISGCILFIPRLLAFF